MNRLAERLMLHLPESGHPLFLAEARWRCKLAFKVLRYAESDDLTSRAKLHTTSSIKQSHQHFSKTCWLKKEERTCQGQLKQGFFEQVSLHRNLLQGCKML